MRLTAGVTVASATDLGPSGRSGSGRYDSIIACEDRLEEALRYLARALARYPTGGKKPVLVHSLRVGLRLMAAGLGGDVVVAGVLHDLLEKAPLGRGDVARRFGPTVARLVAATTNDATIRSALARYEDSLARCARLGPEAIAIRAADLLDNCERLMVLGDERRLLRLTAKLRLLIRAAHACRIEPSLLADLQACYRRVYRGTDGRRPELALVATKPHAAAPRARRAPHHR